MRIQLFSSGVMKGVSIVIGLFLLIGLLLTGGLWGLISNPDLVGELVDVDDTWMQSVQPLPVNELATADCTQTPRWWLTVRSEFIRPYTSDMALTQYSRDTEDYLPSKLNDLESHADDMQNLSVPTCMPPVIHNQAGEVTRLMQHFNQELSLLLAAPGDYDRNFADDIYEPVDNGLHEAIRAVDRFVQPDNMQTTPNRES